jgi:HPt (histidine-containing phosphotransfer) domain-containing protein
METSDLQNPCVDWDYALQYVGDDPELLDGIIDAFLDEGPQNLAQIRQGLANNDAELVGRAAHTLKGSLYYFNSPESTAPRLAYQIELMGKENSLGGAPAVLQELDGHMTRIFDTLKQRVNR